MLLRKNELNFLLGNAMVTYKYIVKKRPKQKLIQKFKIFIYFFNLSIIYKHIKYLCN